MVLASGSWGASLGLEAANRYAIEGSLSFEDIDERPLRWGKRLCVGALKDCRALKLDPESRPRDGKLGC